MNAVMNSVWTYFYVLSHTFILLPSFLLLHFLRIESLPQGQQQLNEGYIGGNASVSANNDSNNNKHSEDNDNDEDEIDDEEDYSVSVSAIIQRRASVRGYRGKRGSRYSRRASSPMDHLMDTVERRRSSVYTTSSGK